MTKRPKITVTEQNLEFVIPTLEKLGGVNKLRYKTYHLDILDTAIINLFGTINVYVEGVKISDEQYYEVPESDYVRPNEPTEPSDVVLGYKTSLENNHTGGKRLPTMAQLEVLRYGDIDRLIAENNQLKIENEKLRECLSESVIQIKYLHEKFKETGSGNAVISKAKQLLNK